ncbi:hypothetical protein [Algoriphagus chordae]|uniref:Outer membrane protein with beta-barrel domain n=1 Tax=Algoriphagus chordae TaxID=237019 RepID=A0A2W7REI4_9BACT|nr:hypothetical protein [Algoriphagus chordae]PZX49125.1 hypothetical protein LV85_03256 [Algoriphagus chordae]
MSTRFKISTFIFFFFASINLSAQSFYKEKNSRDNIVSIGIGPSFAYLDNGGPYRDFSFNIKPSVSLSLTKRLTERFDLRATAGAQWIESTKNASPTVQGIWFENNAAYTAVGAAYYFDVMPSVNLVAFENHMNRSIVNLYGGLGLGVMYSVTDQTKSYSEDAQIYREKLTTAYIPLRAGLSYTLGPYSDIAIESTMMVNFSDNIDGNIGFNKFNDNLIQGQIVYRRYFFSSFDH